MKKILAGLLCAGMLFSSTAWADKLSVDLEAAGMDDLQSAQSVVGLEISRRLSEELSANGLATVTGSGSTAISSVELPFDFTYISIKGEDKDMRTFISDANPSFINYNTGLNVEFFQAGKGTYDILIMGEGAWTLELREMAVVDKWTDVSGVGAYMSDILELSEPLRLRIEIKGNDFSNISIVSYAESEYSSIGWMYDEYLVSELLSKGEEKVFEVIINPGSTKKQISINNNGGIEWSIKAVD